MKKIYKYISITVLIVLSQSCESFLEEVPSDRLVTSNFYETRADAEAGVAAAYEELHQIYERRIFLMSALPADDMKNGRGMGNGNLQNLEFARITADNQWPRDMWTRTYRAIAKANTAIANVPNVSMDTEIRDRLVGETKFLRALYYFNLVRWFGAIPVITSPVASLDEALTGQSSLSEVYDQIIQDLSDADAALPISYPVGGRPTKGAAKILLGKVYLTMGEYQSCVNKLAEVIDNEGTYGYGIHDYYGDNWEIDTELGMEMVFTVEFMEPPGDGNVEMRLMGPRFAIPDPEATLGLDRRGDEADIPTWDLYSQYLPEDERREETLTFDFVSLADGLTYTSTIPLGVKYWETGEIFNANSDANMHVLRYADALLMYAEALNEIGNTAQAYTHLNRVRERAFNSADYNYSGLSPEEFRDAVLQERRLELALEGHRWFDLVRTGRFIETMKAHSILEADLANEPVRLEIGQNIGDHMILMPIPQVEIDVNDQLTQNPAY